MRPKYYYNRGYDFEGDYDTYKDLKWADDPWFEDWDNNGNK